MNLGVAAWETVGLGTEVGGTVAQALSFQLYFPSLLSSLFQPSLVSFPTCLGSHSLVLGLLPGPLAHRPAFPARLPSAEGGLGRC